MDKKEMFETGVMAFVFGIGFWMSAEVWDFVCTFVSGLL